MKLNINKSALTAIFTLTAGMTTFNCSMITNQMNGDLQKEVEEVKMANYLIAGLLMPPAVPAAASALPNVTDNGDGTVYVRSQNLTWAKCSQSSAAGGNMYNSAANDCSSAAAGLMYYCNAANNSCNSTEDPWILNGTGISQVYNSCYLLNAYLPGNNWRVPTISELKVFYDNVYTTNAALFPGTPAEAYWSASAYSPNSTNTRVVNFNTGSIVFGVKDSNLYLRCVSDGP
ncbi:MAG: DUF1566 domain-containing protein [Spirochaetia bacterium]|nr:DUF1566 domain-containing protein [Spirochaetia bacterium]